MATKLNRQQIADRLGMSYRNVIRLENRYGIKPSEQRGSELLFDLADVVKLEGIRAAKFKGGRAPAILTVKQARAKAGKGVGK